MLRIDPKIQVPKRLHIQCSTRLWRYPDIHIQCPLNKWQTSRTSIHPVHQFIMKTSFLFFIPVIAVIVRATPTIRNVSMLTLCATIITMGDLPCNNGRIVRSHSKLVIHWMIIVLIRKFVLCSQPNVPFLMLDFTGDNCFLLSLWSRSYQTILP